MIELPIDYAEVEAIYSQTIGSGYKTIAITSANSGEGKSIVAQAIVQRSCAIGKKVLLVDTNTYNPIFEEKDHNCSDSDNDNVSINIRDKGFSYLPPPKNINDRFKYREVDFLKESVDNWLEKFDCVIFDTISLNSKNKKNIPADIVCEVCSGTILVVEAGVTPENQILECIDKLNVKNVNLIGTVLNDNKNKTLLEELQRETHRLDKYLPNIMIKLRKILSRLVILNVSI